jgi:Heterokaryon incompatibility protein Het-C
MAYSSSSLGLICLICVVCFASSAHAFGAGNIGSTSRIEGQNWRHGDIEDTLLTILMARAAGGKKFSKLDVKRVCQLKEYGKGNSANLIRCTLATGFATIARPSMLVLSSMSAPKLSVFFCGSWASCPLDMERRNLKSLPPGLGAIAQKSTLTSKLGADMAVHVQQLT